MQVYAFKSASGAIKFGISDNPARRLEELHSAGFGRVIAVGLSHSMPEDHARRLEWFIHRSIADSHIRGEWFVSNPKTLGVAALLEKKTPIELLKLFSERGEENVGALDDPSKVFRAWSWARCRGSRQPHRKS